jgi:Domain of unknown function (DUF4956)
VILSLAGEHAYLDLGVRFVIDLAAILVVSLVLYLRRHKRRDLFLAYMFFNIGLFVALGVIAATRISVGVGFGLFALLSIVRLRSEPFTNLELGYLFLALVLGLINGIGNIDRTYALMLNLVVVLTVFVIDHPALNSRVHYRTVVLDSVYTDRIALKAELERRFGVEIHELLINDVDYVRDVTSLSIRYVDLAEPPPAPAMMIEQTTANNGGGTNEGDGRVTLDERPRHFA